MTCSCEFPCERRLALAMRELGCASARRDLRFCLFKLRQCTGRRYSYLFLACMRAFQQRAAAAESVGGEIGESAKARGVPQILVDQHPKRRFHLSDGLMYADETGRRVAEVARQRRQSETRQRGVAQRQ